MLNLNRLECAAPSQVLNLNRLECVGQCRAQHVLNLNRLECVSLASKKKGETAAKPSEKAKDEITNYKMRLQSSAEGNH